MTPQLDRVVTVERGDASAEMDNVVPSMGKRHVEACCPDDWEEKGHVHRTCCCPPPLFILAVTLLELGFFVYYTVAGGSPLLTPDLSAVTRGSSEVAVVPLDSTGAVPLDSLLLYRPDRRWQPWRFVTYMVLHASWWHLTFNLLVQLVVGLPLEMVHGSSRVAAIYLTGVLAGSLGTSVCDAGRQVYLVGASGGVYALLTAHIANVLLNYNHMELGVQRLLVVLLIAGCDVGLAIYRRYALVAPPMEPAISYAAHLAGGVAGLALGLVVLRSFAPKQRDPLTWWLALGVLLACMLFAVLFNVIPAGGDHQYV